MGRLARNAGVICRQAKIAEAKKTDRDRYDNIFGVTGVANDFARKDQSASSNLICTGCLRRIPSEVLRTYNGLGHLETGYAASSKES